MSPFIFALICIALFLTLASLVAGLVLMLKGGELNKKYGNKLMQARVAMQGLAILLFLIAFMGSK